MNKGELIDHVAGTLDTTKAEAARAVEAVFDAITAGIEQDGRVGIAGFGAFTRRERPARTGVNPATQQRFEIKPTITCGFRPAPALKQTIAPSGDHEPAAAPAHAEGVTPNGQA